MRITDRIRRLAAAFNPLGPAGPGSKWLQLFEPGQAPKWTPSEPPPGTPEGLICRVRITDTCKPPNRE
jgi:hypothetical protein